MKKLTYFIIISLFTTYSYASNGEKDIFDQCDAKLVKLLQADQSNKEDITNIYIQLKNDTTILAKGYRSCIKLSHFMCQDYDKTNTYNKINKAYTFLLTQDYKSGLITYCMGYCFKNGHGVEIDQQKAIEFYKKAVDLGNTDAMNNLAGIYYRGKGGIEKDIQKAIELYTKAVDLGNTSAMNNLAVIYGDGIGGIEKDIQKAIEFLEKAIELKNAAAMINLAYIYKSGIGIEKDIQKAIGLYEKAIELKNAAAMNNLAYIYKSGIGIEKDIQKAIGLYEKAIDLGNTDAMNNLAGIYYRGKGGIEKDIPKAIELYEKVIDLGNSDAMNNLAYIYQDGTGGIEKDIQKAIELYTKAIELKNTAAMSNLAYIYKSGNGIEKDIQKAIELYTKAVDLGDHENIYNLAYIYENEQSMKNLKYAEILEILQKEELTLDHLSDNEIYATKFIFTLFNKRDFSKEFLLTSPQDLPMNQEPFLNLEDEKLKERWRGFGENCLGLLGKLSLRKYSLYINNLLDERDDDNIGIWLDVPEIIVNKTSFVPISEKFYNSLECLQWEKHGQNTLSIPSHYIGLRLYKMGDSFYAAIGQNAMKYGDEIMQSLEYKIEDNNLDNDISILKKEYIEFLKEFNKVKVQLFLSDKTDGLNQNFKKYLFL